MYTLYVTSQPRGVYTHGMYKLTLSRIKNDKDKASQSQVNITRYEMIRIGEDECIGYFWKEISYVCIKFELSKEKS